MEPGIHLTFSYQYTITSYHYLPDLIEWNITGCQVQSSWPIESQLQVGLFATMMSLCGLTWCCTMGSSDPLPTKYQCQNSESSQNYIMFNIVIGLPNTSNGLNKVTDFVHAYGIIMMTNALISLTLIGTGQKTHTKAFLGFFGTPEYCMRNRHPHRENVENIFCMSSPPGSNNHGVGEE